MSNIVQIDSRSVDETLNNLSDTDTVNKILFDAVKEGARVLQNNTIKSFKSALGASADHISRWNNQPFWSGIRVKDEKPYVTSIVHIMGDHRLKWFEKGTNDRKTKGRKIVGYNRNRRVREGKGHDTGRIAGRYFFKQTVQSSESSIMDTITRSINNALETIMK